MFGQLGDRMQCAPGCASCCADELSVTAIEADAIRAHLAGLETPIAIGPAGACAALDADGRCQIYSARPLRCRTHGVPIVSRDERTHLPVVSSCELNFAGPGELSDLPASCRLDAETLATKLWAIDAAWSDSRDEPRNRRFSLRELLEIDQISPAL